MKPVELVAGQKVEGILLEAICGCLIMRTWDMRRITYHTGAKISVLFAKLEGHYIIIQVNELGTELELIKDYGKMYLY